MKSPKSLPIPTLDWQNNFKTSVCAVGFKLHLSRTMLEFLCAVADDVTWDRGAYGDRRTSSLNNPDSWYVTERSLEKRGLLCRLSQKEIAERSFGDTCCQLTPAGKLVVQLIKAAGMFLEADAAIEKKGRRA